MSDWYGHGERAAASSSINSREIGELRKEFAALKARVEQLEHHAGPRCPKCNDVGESPISPHACPFKREIHDDDSLCTCCDACAHECAMDI